MKRTAQITLKITWDDEINEHPAKWDWRGITCIADEDGDVQVVKSFDILGKLRRLLSHSKKPALEVGDENPAVVFDRLTSVEYIKSVSCEADENACAV